MKIKVAGVSIVYKAIESIHFDAESSQLVIRTVSGREYRDYMPDEEKAERAMTVIFDRMNLCDSL